VLLDNRSLLVGEIRKERFREIFDEHLADPSVTGIYTEGSFSQIEELDPTATLTLWVLVGAAIADSINPCTIAVMTMLLGVILTTQGKKRMLLASLTFVSVIFISYYLMGLGLLHTITNTQLTNIFFVFVTVAALVLAILEIKAYFRYRPGFFSVEIPVFLRPYMKNVIANATSIPGVAFAALICSLFLLPCSSGPYLVVLGMLAKSVTLQGLLYLFVYNLIFVLPMAFIALVIYLGKATVDEIGRFRETHIRNLHLFAGLLFLLLFLLLLNQMLDIVQM
jgi:cytochrome c biogenesis protein CcdA